MAGSLLNFFDRFETTVFDRFENKLFAVSLFDALAPGAEREAEDAPTNADTAVWWKRFFFPLKNYLGKVDESTLNPRYGLIHIPIRWLLGETKATQFDILKRGYAFNIDVRLMSHASTLSKLFFQYQDRFFALKENFVIGHGPKRGKINIMAFFNPFNWFRALDNLLINNGLRLIAKQIYKSDLVSEDKMSPRKGLLLFLGIILCTLGAALRLPRVITQYVFSATFKPLWNCIKYDLTHKAAKKATPWWGWVLAVALTAINLVLIGITFGGAAPVVSHLSNAASKLTVSAAEAAAPAVMAPAQEMVIEPAAIMINEAVKLPLPNGYLQWFPETSACVSAVLAAAPADCVAKPLFHMYPAASNDRDNRSAFFPSTQGEDAQEPVNNVVPDYDLQVFKKVSNT